MKKLDGEALAKTLRAEIAERVKAHLAAGHRPPGLATVLVGTNQASERYVRNKRKACEAWACSVSTTPCPRKPVNGNCSI